MGPSPPPKKKTKGGWAQPPQFSAHVYCGQTAGWITSTRKRPLVAMAAVHYPAVCTVVAPGVPVNREVQCIIIEITALYRITALYCTSRLTGNARRDNGTAHAARIDCRHRDQWAWPCTHSQLCTRWLPLPSASKIDTQSY